MVTDLVNNFDGIIHHRFDRLLFLVGQLSDLVGRSQHPSPYGRVFYDVAIAGGMQG